jgi:hypothetical protein
MYEQQETIRRYDWTMGSGGVGIDAANVFSGESAKFIVNASASIASIRVIVLSFMPFQTSAIVWYAFST